MCHVSAGCEHRHHGDRPSHTHGAEVTPGAVGGRHVLGRGVDATPVPPTPLLRRAPTVPFLPARHGDTCLPFRSVLGCPLSSGVGDRCTA